MHHLIHDRTEATECLSDLPVGPAAPNHLIDEQNGVGVTRHSNMGPIGWSGPII